MTPHKINAPAFSKVTVLGQGFFLSNVSFDALNLLYHTAIHFFLFFCALRPRSLFVVSFVCYMLGGEAMLILFF